MSSHPWPSGNTLSRIPRICTRASQNSRRMDAPRARHQASVRAMSVVRREIFHEHRAVGLGDRSTVDGDHLGDLRGPELLAFSRRLGGDVITRMANDAQGFGLCLSGVA